MIKNRIWLTTEQKTEAVRRYVAGETPRAIGESFGVCANNVANAVRKAGVAIRDRSAGRREYRHREDAFDAVTDESAYWIGFLFADGSVVHYSTGSPMLTVTVQAGDRRHLEKLRAFIGAEHPLYERISHGCWIEDHFVTATAPQTMLSLRSPRLCSALEDHGMRRKSLQRRATPALAESQHFWRGVVDGDGYVSISDNKPRLGLCGGRELMEQFLAFVDASDTTNLQHRQKIWVAQLNCAPAVRGIRKMYENAPIALDRKMEIATDILRRWQ